MYYNLVLERSTYGIYRAGDEKQGGVVEWGGGSGEYKPE